MTAAAQVAAEVATATATAASASVSLSSRATEPELLVLTEAGGFRSASAVLQSAVVIADDTVLTEVAVRRAGGTASVVDQHVRAGVRSPHPWPDLADVLVGTSDPRRSRRSAAMVVSHLARRHPGALVVALAHGERYCTVRLGAGALLALTSVSVPVRPVPPPVPWQVLASVLHAWLAVGLQPGALAPAFIRTTTSSEPGRPRGWILLRPMRS